MALISHEDDKSDHGVLKYTELQQEVEILRFLARMEAPGNHTIRGVRVLTLDSGGFVIYMPHGRIRLTDLKRSNENVWSAAKQLVEGVAFMHDCGVAHRDIKPENVLISPNNGYLSIIDFNLAVLVHGPGNKSYDFVGTDAYMAPEVSSGRGYDPIRADLWSCGKTLQELYSPCNLSSITMVLTDISNDLMKEDPFQRPSMSEVLERMTASEPSLSESHSSTR